MCHASALWPLEGLFASDIGWLKWNRLPNEYVIVYPAYRLSAPIMQWDYFTSSCCRNLPYLSTYHWSHVVTLLFARKGKKHFGVAIGYKNTYGYNPVWARLELEASRIGYLPVPIWLNTQSGQSESRGGVDRLACMRSVVHACLLSPGSPFDQQSCVIIQIALSYFLCAAQLRRVCIW